MQLERALNEKSGFLRYHVNAYLRLKRASLLEFVNVSNAMPSTQATLFQQALEKISVEAQQDQHERGDDS